MKSQFNRDYEPSMLLKIMCNVVPPSMIGIFIGGLLLCRPDDYHWQPAGNEAQIIQTMPASTRLMTANEVSILRLVFDNQLNVSQTQFVFYDTTNPALASDTPDRDTNLIRIFGKQYSSDDYSQDKNSFLFGDFFFEATRLWQYQNKQNFSGVDLTDYKYNLGNLYFSDYGPLQQASIMEDYARRFLHPAHDTHLMAETYGKDNCDADEVLARVVEDQFPNAKKLRLSFSQSRPLTAEENALTHGIFGDQIDTSATRNIFNPQSCFNEPASVENDKEINFWSAKYASDNFARTTDIFNFGTFLHEITHVWQIQTENKYTNMDFYTNVYAYPIDTKKWKFSDYGKEQQGAIIEDYVRYFLFPTHTMRFLQQTDNNVEQLKILVEDQFPAAKKTREYYQSQEKLTAPAPAVF